MNRENIETGDWVKVKSIEGELLIGFIEARNEPNETVKIKIIQAEQPFMVGNTIEIKHSHVKKLLESPSKTEEEIRNLIDLALQTQDEEWFKQLTGQLSSMGDKHEMPNSAAVHSARENRLNSPHVN